MAFDPAKLKNLLNQTGLQQKDIQTYQVIKSLIEGLITTNTTVTSVISGGSAVGPQGPAGPQGPTGLPGPPSFNEEDVEQIVYMIGSTASGVTLAQVMARVVLGI